MGNRITPELAAGMVRSLIDILAASMQPQAGGTELQAQTEAAAGVYLATKEGGHGVG